MVAGQLIAGTKGRPGIAMANAFDIGDARDDDGDESRGTTRDLVPRNLDESCVVLSTKQNNLVCILALFGLALSLAQVMCCSAGVN
ncbi:hypothetical protein TWF694_004842 [Orbilia ellipsospora]|uniref:Uncharacterized protein n=1 Tax=Orbilia ellipsospora TaxID=2528407 RepID=A0AAV9WVV8_9PEZI